MSEAKLQPSPKHLTAMTRLLKKSPSRVGSTWSSLSLLQGSAASSFQDMYAVDEIRDGIVDPRPWPRRTRGRIGENPSHALQGFVVVPRAAGPADRLLRCVGHLLKVVSCDLSLLTRASTVCSIYGANGHRAHRERHEGEAVTWLLLLQARSKCCRDSPITMCKVLQDQSRFKQTEKKVPTQPEVRLGQQAGHDLRARAVSRHMVRINSSTSLR